MKKKTLISEFVKNKRNEEGLSVRAFAEKHRISKTYINKFELGMYDDPSLLVAKKFCSVFDIGPDEFVTDFYFTDPKIDSAFTLKKHFGERFGNEFVDTYGTVSVLKLYQQYSEIYKLSNLNYVDYDNEYKRSSGHVFVPRSASCHNKHNEEIWLFRFLNAFEGNRGPANRTYDYLDHVVCNVAAYTREELGCANFVFIVPNKKMYNYLTERRFAQTDTSVILVYCKKDKNFSDPYLLFGKNFLE